MKGSPSKPNQPIIALSMTDEDVVSRVAGLLGTTYTRHDRNEGRWKPSYQLRIKGSRARWWMEHLRPVMGLRRQEQIDIALASYDPDYGRILSHDKARQIRARKAAGESAVDLGEEFGVTKWMIYAVCQGRSYGA